MTRQFPDLLNAMEWNLVGRGTYQATEGAMISDRLLPRNWLIRDSNVLIIGTSSATARSSWHTGGWATQALPFLPSTTSQFVAMVFGEKKLLKLGSLTLCVFPKLSEIWSLEISFPYWFRDVSVEIWKYDGRDYDEFVPLEQMQQKIDSLL